MQIGWRDDGQADADNIANVRLGDRLLVLVGQQTVSARMFPFRDTLTARCQHLLEHKLS